MNAVHFISALCVALFWAGGVALLRIWIPMIPVYAIPVAFGTVWAGAVFAFSLCRAAGRRSENDYD